MSGNRETKFKKMMRETLLRQDKAVVRRVEDDPGGGQATR